MSLDDHQAIFNTQLVRLTASAGLPLNWVTNPEFHKLVAILDPDIVIPGRKALTQTLLPAYLTDVRAAAKSKASGQTVTIQCDGWTGINNHHLVAFMATTLKDVSLLSHIIINHTHSLFLALNSQSLRHYHGTQNGRTSACTDGGGSIPCPNPVQGNTISSVQ